MDDIRGWILLLFSAAGLVVVAFCAANLEQGCLPATLSNAIAGMFLGFAGVVAWAGTLPGILSLLVVVAAIAVLIWLSRGK